MGAAQQRDWLGGMGESERGGGRRSESNEDQPVLFSRD